MIFTKNKGMLFVALLIALAVYNVIVFTIPFERGNMFWTGYGFSMLAMLLTAAVGFRTLGREGLKSRFFRVPLILVARRYLIIQVIVGLLEMILYFIPFQYGLALNTVLLGSCLIGLIASEVGKDAIEHIDAKVKEKIFYIKSLQVDVEGLIGEATDASVKKVLTELAETIRYSDPMSSPQLAAIENKIEAKIAGLAETIENADTDPVKTACNELQQLFAERNRKCKILK